MVIEWAPFRLTPGVSETDLLEASEALQTDFLQPQAGFLRRELVHLSGEQWGDLVYWESEAAAKRAMETAASNPACFRYFHLMEDADHNEPGQGVQVLAVRKSYAGG